MVNQLSLKHRENLSLFFRHFQTLFSLFETCTTSAFVVFRPFQWNAFQRKLYANVRCHNLKKVDEMKSISFTQKSSKKRKTLKKGNY